MLQIKPTNFPRSSFLLATIVPTVLLCLAISLGSYTTYQQYKATQDEIKGLHLTHHLFHAMGDLQQIRGLIQIQVHRNNQDLTQQIKSYQLDVLNDLDNSDWPELRTYFNTNKDTKEIFNNAKELFSISFNHANSLEVFNRYSELIQAIQSLIHTIADRSQLILDPQLETYYLMDFSILKLPAITESIAKLRGLGGGMLAKESISIADKTIYVETLAVSDYQIKQLRFVENYIKQTSPDISQSITSSINRYNGSVSTFLNNCADFPCILDTKFTPDIFFNEVSASILSLQQSYSISTKTLETLLNLRAKKHMDILRYTLLATCLTIMIIFLIAHRLYIQQLNTHKALTHASETDPLTEIPNRRYFELIYAREINHAQRDKKSLTFGVLDIDFFKAYNDNYGHQQGDLALKKVADSLRTSLKRSGDFYFRYGGEEFCFLINTPTQDSAVQMNEKIRAAVENLAIEHAASSASSVLTVSIGAVFVAEVNNPSFDCLMRYADALLYQAKDLGRNRCELIPLPQTLSEAAQPQRHALNH